MKLRVSLSVIGILLFTTVSGFVVAEGQQETAEGGRPEFVSIGTASPAGAYYPLGVAMADLWNRTIEGTRFSSQETGGSVANMNLLNGGEIELGMSNENVAFNAYNGNPPFESTIDVNGGWVLNNSNAVFVALESSGITSVADLEGKNVALGAPGSSANVFGELILASEGLEDGDYEATYMGWQESADALNDGFIDAALMVGGQPFPAISSLAVRTEVRVLTFNTERFTELSEYPYASGPIPAEMYNMAADGDSVLIRSVVYVDPALPEDLVYDMVKAVFENIPTLESAHPSARGTRLFSQEAAEQIGLTMHPGAIKYAQEVGEW